LQQRRCPTGGEFSQIRDLPALKLGATDLDAILLKTHSLIDAANGPNDSGREMVKFSVDGQEIEIPHLSLASSVAFPNEVFGFSYMYNQAGKPISSVTIAAGGVKFRRAAGICLSMLFLTSLMIGSAYCWNKRNRSALGMPICSAVGLLLVLLAPWNRFLPGFVLYQSYSPFLLIRSAPEIVLLSLVATLIGIPLSYFLLRK